jgi:NapC/NirT cytochrome c family, N-terminal region
MRPSKPLLTRLFEWLSPVVYLSSNPLSLIGVVLVTSATVLWVFLLPTLLRNETNNPYVGIPAFLLLPGVFVGGLILIPIGIVLRRRSRRRQGLEAGGIPALRLDSPELRRLLAFVAAASFANVIIASQWGYSTVNYMDSAAFCGLTCHNVMQPEYTAYLNSPHARVACAECHIGSGASWFVRSKLSGAGQVLAVMLNNYPRPIPSPVANLRPAQETCEHCHWPQRFTGDMPVVHTEYSEDEQNTPATTVLLMKVGGRAWNGTVGIHGAHLADNTTIEYVATDAKRQVIPQVIYTDASGKQTIYNSTDTKVTPQALAAGERRIMDCVDCHNRPTHIFQMPGRALDDAMTTDHISPRLPYIKKQALAALKVDYPDRDTGRRQSAAMLDAFYRTNYPQVYAQQHKQIENAIAAVQAIYARNIFPEMKVTWGTYVNNIGHLDSPGCFRCHDGNHTSADGRTIPNDCNTCHELAAVGEQNPKILTDLGIVPGQAPGVDPP